jgi:hypothetical protein
MYTPVQQPGGGEDERASAKEGTLESALRSRRTVRSKHRASSKQVQGRSEQEDSGRSARCSSTRVSPLQSKVDLASDPVVSSRELDKNAWRLVRRRPPPPPRKLCGLVRKGLASAASDLIRFGGCDAMPCPAGHCGLGAWPGGGMIESTDACYRTRGPANLSAAFPSWPWPSFRLPVKG